jgi:hypothetical protein
MNSYKVVRTFHPIGQGAFYTERHKEFNIVYDCGAASRLSNYSKSVVSSAFSENEDIDILFISHFDYDHVSAISTLVKSVNSIKTVVLPLLSTKEINLLVNINRALSLSVLGLIRNPKAYFGANTKIIFVKPANEPDDIDTGEEFINLTDLPNGNGKDIFLKSGGELCLGGKFRWVFVPYNYKCDDRQLKLIQKLVSAGFDVQRMCDDETYLLDHICTPSQRKKLRQIYDRIDGNVNENSMLLYSGPSTSINDSVSCVCDDKECFPIDSLFASGCVFTGDCDLNKVNVQDVYASFIENVGTIQIPHHGSALSFQFSSFIGLKNTIFCPVSFGTKNSYGHPAPYLINLLSLNGLRPILVNELPTSKYVQSIKIYDKKVLQIRNIVGCL